MALFGAIVWLGRIQEKDFWVIVFKGIKFLTEWEDCHFSRVSFGMDSLSGKFA
jgi:hypothetical protein